MDYLDFELEIGLGKGREYPVAVLRSPAGEVRETMHFPFGELELENQLQALQIALLRSGGERRLALSPEQQTVRDFGQALFDALLTGKVLGRYDVSQERAVHQSKGLRLKLRIQSPKLAALPWEFMHDSRSASYMCLSRNTPIVRYLELPQPIQPLTVTPPLRILGMVASPQDLPLLKVAIEKQWMERALESLQTKGLVALAWLEGQTWGDLQRAMRRGPWHIFHFIGHGGFDRNTDEGIIALADRGGRTQRLSATQLGTLLADHRSLRLALLNTCEGAWGGGQDIFSSTASILVRRGIPAVVAMQYEITDRAAIEFGQAFYEAIADGMPVDAAVAEARKAISLSVNNTVEWGTPVLHMRASDGVLFHTESHPPGEGERGETEAKPPESEPERSAETPTPPPHTSVETPEPTETPALPSSVPLSPPVPQLTEVISPDNIDQMTQLACLGRGVVRCVASSGNGQWLAVASRGVYLYDTRTLAKERFIETGSGVNQVAFSPDGTMLLVRLDRGPSVQLWRVSDGTLLHVLGNKFSWSHVAFSPDRKLFALAFSTVNNVYVWQVDDGTLFHTLTGSSTPITSVAFSCDGILASGSRDGTVQLWQPLDGTLLYTLKGYSDKVFSVAFSPNGKLLASGTANGTVHLWQVDNGTLLRIMKDKVRVTEGVFDVAFSPDSTMLASGFRNEVRVWQVPDVDTAPELDVPNIPISKDVIPLWLVDDKPLLALEVHKGKKGIVTRVVFSPNGKLLASRARDNTGHLWQIDDGALLHKLEPCSGLTFAPDGKLLALGSSNDAVSVWWVDDQVQSHTLGEYTMGVTSVAFSRNGILASGSQRKVRLWQPSDGALLHTLDAGEGTSVAFSPDGELLATGGARKVRLWRTSDWTLLHTLTGHTRDVTSIAFSPDGKLLASGARYDKAIRVWRVSDGALLNMLTEHSGKVTSVAFSCDGTLASGSQDGTIQLWQPLDGTLLHTLEGYTDLLFSVAFSPNGKLFVSGNRVWWKNRDDWMPLVELKVDGNVTIVTFSPDGALLVAEAVANKRSKHYLWNASTWAQLRNPKGYPGIKPTSTAFSLDGTLLALGGDDGTVRLWGVSDD